MYGQMKRHEVQILREAGHQQNEISDLTGVAERSVRRIEQEDRVADFDDRAACKRRGVGRPSKVNPILSKLTAWIAADPEIASLELLRLARAAGYDGGKTQLYDAVRKVRPKRQKPVVRFEGLPGEFTQHDFGQVDVRYLDGRVQRVRKMDKGLEQDLGELDSAAPSSENSKRAPFTFRRWNASSWSSACSAHARRLVYFSTSSPP
jgi:transposase